MVEAAAVAVVRARLIARRPSASQGRPDETGQCGSEAPTKEVPSMRRNRWFIGAIVVALLGATLIAARPPDKGPPTGGEEATNNLSYPVIWADGVAKAVPGTMLESSLNLPYDTDDEGTWYLQRTPGNTWQAEHAMASGTVSVDDVGWGDNLARPWVDGSKIRVETVLFTDLETAMTGFTMKYFGGEGIDELWGTNGLLYDRFDATVYTQLATLTIERILDADGGPVETPQTVPGFDAKPYSSEVNVQGKVIFGGQWDTKVDGLPAGTYRVTMAFGDGTNVSLDGAATNHGTVDASANTTYHDVVITSGKTGGGGGGGGGGGAVAAVAAVAVAAAGTAHRGSHGPPPACRFERPGLSQRPARSHARCPSHRAR
jgi:hypothetical protein